MFVASGVFQIILSGTLAVGAGLLTICWVMQDIQQLFDIFPGFIEQGNILRVPDMRRRAGSVYDHGTAVAASSGTLIFIVVFLRFCRLLLYYAAFPPYAVLRSTQSLILTLKLHSHTILLLNHCL